MVSREVSRSALLVLTLVLFATALKAHAQTADAGAIVSLTGDAQLVRAGATTAVTPAAALKLGDRLAVGSGGQLVATLADGSKLTLASATTMTIDEETLGAGATRTHTKLSLLAGRLHSIVTTVAGAAVPDFEVYTPNAAIGLRGTDFLTLYSEGVARPTYGTCLKFTDVQVRDGVVGVANRARPAAVDRGHGWIPNDGCLRSGPAYAGTVGVGQRRSVSAAAELRRATASCRASASTTPATSLLGGRSEARRLPRLQEWYRSAGCDDVVCRAASRAGPRRSCTRRN